MMDSFLYNISEAHVSCMFHEEHWLVLMKNRTIGVMLVRQYDAAWGSRHCRSDRLACENGIIFPSMLLIHHGSSLSPYVAVYVWRRTA